MLLLLFIIIVHSGFSNCEYLNVSVIETQYLHKIDTVSILYLRQLHKDTLVAYIHRSIYCKCER